MQNRHVQRQDSMQAINLPPEVLKLQGLRTATSSFFRGSSSCFTMGVEFLYGLGAGLIAPNQISQNETYRKENLSIGQSPGAPYTW